MKWKSRKFVQFVIGLVLGLIFAYFDNLGMSVGMFIIYMCTGYGAVNVCSKAASKSDFFSGKRENERAED